MSKSVSVILSLGLLFALTSGVLFSGCSSDDPDACMRIVYKNSPEVNQFDMAFAETDATPELKLELYPDNKSANKVIAYSLPAEEEVSMSVYSTSGKLLKTLLSNETKKAGFHGVVWDGTNAFGQRVDGAVYVELNTGSGNLTLNI